MGPKSTVSIEEAVNALKKHIKYFILEEKPKWSSECWEIISAELNNKWNANTVRTNVNNDRRQILTLALKECGYFSEKKNIDLDISDTIKAENIHSSDSDQDDNNGDPDYNNYGSYFKDTKDLDEFDVEIRRELWNSIIISSFDENMHRHFELKKKDWTDIIAFAFWEQYRLKCAFMFKKGAICTNGNNFLTVQAYCKSKKCDNRLLGVVQTPPDDTNSSVYIKIHCRDTRHEENHEDLQRPLHSERRKTISKSLKNIGVHGYTRQTAPKLIRPGETTCPFLYKSNVLRQAKKQLLDNEQGIKPFDRKDVFAAIDRLNDNVIYKNSIVMVCKSPFIVIYVTPSQMHCYKEYRRIHRKQSSVCIDATGGVVRKIVTGTEKSSYIYLYEIVINFQKTTQSVYQMLSSVHDSDIITLWLQRWIRLGAKPPHEVVSDGARAQLNAISIAFNSISLKKYIDVCYENAKKKITTDIVTYIKLDVAHFVHNVTGWECFKTVLHSSVKKFYIYCICLLMNCNNIKKFEHIILLILILCNNAHDDSIMDVNGEKITPFTARSQLENLISCKNIENVFSNITDEINKISFDDEKRIIQNTLSNVTENDLPTTAAWMNNILKKSTNIIYEGKNLQCFYLPKLVKPLVEAAMEFPLWTNISTPDSDLRATSSYVEENFKDLKVTLKKQIPLPTDVYKFLKAHLDYLMGGIVLMRMTINKFISDNLNNSEKNHSEIFNCTMSEVQENSMENNFSINLNNNRSDSSQIVDQAELIISNVTQLNEELNSTEVNVNDILNESVEIVNNNKEYNLSSVTEEKNKNDPVENWMGKAKDNKLQKFEWMLTEQSDLNETKADLKTNCNDAKFDISEIISLEHSYSVNSSTPIDEKKLKRTLSTALEETARHTTNKCGKYFQECLEIKLINNFANTQDNTKDKTRKKKSFLLHNGHMRKAVHFNNCDWLPHNTCPFDTVVHLLFECIIQDVKFLEFCQKSQNAVCKFVVELKRDGTCDKIYEKRFKILYPIYKNTEKMQTKIGKENYIATPISRTIFCEDNINALWNRLFVDEPSIFEENYCPTFNCDDNNNNNKNVPLFSINYATIDKHGFSSLQKALNFRSVIYNMRCGRCKGTKRTSKMNPNYYIYIELDIKTASDINGRKCKLRELPVYLTIPVTNENGTHEVRYRLSGAAGYAGFHYIAYCRRISGLWISYNDLSKKPEPITDNLQILPHGVIYIRSEQ